MNCVHLLPYFAPAWSYGGVVRAAYGLTAALTAEGHQITVVTTDAGNGGQRLRKLHETVNGMHVYRCRNVVPGLRRINLSSPVGMLKRLRTVLADADVLHVHELRTVENLIGIRVARQLRVPVILSPHGTIGYGAGRSAVKRMWDKIFGQWMAARVDHVVALTAFEADEVRRLWIQVGAPLPEAYISVVPNGVHVDDIGEPLPREVFRAHWHIPADSPLILFLGRLHERKGIHHLIVALRDMPSAWLAVVGPDEGQLHSLQKLAAELQVSDRVVFTGLLDGTDKKAAFSGADILALPAIGEGLPMVVLEAMAAGLPVAISDECHLPEVIEAGAGIRLEPLIGSDMAKNLEPVLNNPQQLARMGRAGQALVAEHFTWAAIARQVAAVYKSI